MEPKAIGAAPPAHWTPILRYNQHRVIHMILCKDFHMPVVKPISDLQRNFGSNKMNCNISNFIFRHN